MPADISPEDRDAIYDVLARYVWAMDNGDIEGVVNVFSADGEIKDYTGRRWTSPGGPRAFASHFLSQPGSRGGQHWVQHLGVAPAAGGAYLVTSYWFGAMSREGVASIGGLGTYHDTCVRSGDRWLVKEKLIDPWNSETSPPLGVAR